MKKILCAVIASLLAFSLMACQNSAKPEDTISGYFEASKASDTVKANSFVNPKNIESSSGTSSSSDSEEAALESNLLDYMKSNNKKVEYSIKGADIKENTAVVTVDCKFVDASSILKDAIADYIPKALANAFSGAKTSDSDTSKEIAELMKDKIKTTKETFISKTIKVNCIKATDKWYIDKENDDLKNVFSSNFISAGNDISKSFGAAGSSSNSASSSAESPANKLSEINSYVISDVWNNGFCEIDSYLKTGKGSTGESIDIDFTLQQLDDSMKKKANYDSYISALDDSKYSNIKEIWKKLSAEADSLYGVVKAKKPVANDASAKFDTGKFQQYQEAFSDKITALQ